MAKVAKRYAQALMDLADELRKLDILSRDLEVIEKIIDKSKEFRLFLRSPVIPNERKKKIIAALFESRVDPIAFQFLLLLVKKNRENVLAEIIKAFYQLRDEKLGIVNVTVKTARTFTQPQEEKLLQYLQEYTGKRVSIRFSIDKSLKGGFIVQIGDTVLDSSIRRQLELLREKLTEKGFAGSS